MAKAKILFCRFPGGAIEHPDSSDWYWRTAHKAERHPAISEVIHWRLSDTPITASRNKALRHAKQNECDLVLMLDSDNAPDCEPDGKPFWDTSIDFLLRHNGPCCVAAPYCGSSPNRCVFVFRWVEGKEDCYLEQYTREEAATLSGIKKAGALPTGVILIDMRGVDKMSPPYFYYEWKDEEECDKAATEDVAFTRDMAFAGVPIYCNWDAWSGHWKSELIRKPKLPAMAAVPRKFRRDAVICQKIRRNSYPAAPLVCKESNGVPA